MIQRILKAEGLGRSVIKEPVDLVILSNHSFLLRNEMDEARVWEKVRRLVVHIMT